MISYSSPSAYCRRNSTTKGELGEKRQHNDEKAGQYRETLSPPP